MKESFLIYKSFYEPVKGLSFEQKGKLFDAIFEYQINKIEPENNSEILMPFLFFKNQFSLDSQKILNINVNDNVNDNVFRKFAHLKITVEENKKLIDLGYNQEKITEIYDSIENYKKNTNYKSLYITALKWLKLDKERNEQKLKDLKQKISSNYKLIS